MSTFLEQLTFNGHALDSLSRGFLSDAEVDNLIGLPAPAPVRTKPSVTHSTVSRTSSKASTAVSNAPKSNLGGNTVNVGDKHQTTARVATNDPGNDNINALKNAHLTPSLVKAVQQRKTTPGNY